MNLVVVVVVVVIIIISVTVVDFATSHNPVLKGTMFLH